MVIEVSNTKASNLRGKTFRTSIELMQHKVNANKLADSYNNINNNCSKANEDKGNSRNS